MEQRTVPCIIHILSRPTRLYCYWFYPERDHSEDERGYKISCERIKKEKIAIPEPSTKAVSIGIVVMWMSIF